MFLLSVKVVYRLKN